MTLDAKARLVQSLLTSVAIVLGGYWFIARDMWTRRLDVTMADYAVVCNKDGPNLLSIKIELENTGNRTVSLFSEVYWGFELSVPGHGDGKSKMVRFDVPSFHVEPRTLAFHRPDAVEQIEGSFVIPPGSKGGFWRDFALDSKIKSIRIEGAIAMNDLNFLAVSGVYNVESKCSP